jgi:ribosomal protein L29
MSKDFKKLKEADLLKELSKKREELQKIRFTFSHGGNKNTKKQGLLKKEISQILNEIRQRELEK